MANPVPGYPDETNTGVPSGTALTKYTGPRTITTDGIVLENMIIDGSLVIEADNVTIKNSIITFKGMWGIDAEAAANVTIENCEIVGPGSSGDSNAGILGSGTFVGNDIHHVENGIVLTDGSSVVQGNYIHDLLDGSRDPHYDGISVQGGQDGVLIEGNTIVSRDTSNIFIKNDFGPINDVTVQNNLMYGDAGYIVYVDGRASGGPITGVTISDNLVEKGFYGTFSVDNSSPAISGNTEFTPGQPVVTPTPQVPQQPSPSPTPAPEPSVPDPAPSPTPVPPTPNDGLQGKSLRGTNASDRIDGSDGNDVIFGRGGDDELSGEGGNDVLLGGSGRDSLFGGDGNDELNGGPGADFLTGGAGEDFFVFNTLRDSGLSYRNFDTIADFSQSEGDRIDLSGVDAKSGWGDQAFTYIGNDRFSNQAGELRYVVSENSTVVLGDVNGDGRTDFALKLVGIVDLQASDFIF